MRQLSYIDLPLTEDPRQVFTVDLTIDGTAFHARVEIRYLSVTDRWVISIWDNASSELLVNQIPLVCSYGMLNDLLVPFRHLRNGTGIGSLFVLRNMDEPASSDPKKDNLQSYTVLWGDTFGVVDGEDAVS